MLLLEFAGHVLLADFSGKKEKHSIRLRTVRHFASSHCQWGMQVSSLPHLAVDPIDGFQMSIKRPTSRGQARAQEAAVQQIFHLERSSFFSTNSKDSTQRLLACTMHTDALNTDPDSCPPEVKLRPMKTIYSFSMYTSFNLNTHAHHTHTHYCMLLCL